MPLRAIDGSISRGRIRGLLTRTLGIASAGMIALGMGGCVTQNYGDGLFRLQMASQGKDVMWVPTRVEMAHEMLSAAGVKPGDIVYDLGSGDGVIPIEASKKHGVRSVGIEYNPDLVELSKRNAVRAGIDSLASFRRGDIFVEDFSEATVLTLYLGESLNARLMPKILKMKPGTRVVSNTFRMESWIPDREIRLVSGDQAYLWVVPADLHGQWEFSGFSDGRTAQVSLRQKKQFFDAYISWGNRGRTLLSEGKIHGSEVNFEFVTPDNNKLTFQGAASNDLITGALIHDHSIKIIGRRIR